MEYSNSGRLVRAGTGSVSDAYLLLSHFSGEISIKFTTVNGPRSGQAIGMIFLDLFTHSFTLSPGNLVLLRVSIQ